LEHNFPQPELRFVCAGTSVEGRWSGCRGRVVDPDSGPRDSSFQRVPPLVLPDIGVNRAQWRDEAADYGKPYKEGRKKPDCMADLIVKAAVKEELNDKNVASDFYQALDEEVSELLEDAADRAESNGRKTVQPRDL